MVDKGKHYPLNYDKLWSSFKHSDYKLLRFRPSSWFDEYDIKFYLGEEVDIVENMRGESHLRLKDGLRIVFFT